MKSPKKLMVMADCSHGLFLPDGATSPESLGLFENGKYDTSQPTKLNFDIGGFNGECHRVEWKRGKLQYRRAIGAYMWEPEIELSPTPEAWARFWLAVEAAGVWQWKKRYDDNDVCDGTQWSLKLKHQGHSVSCYGSNAYPGSAGPACSRTSSFAKFLRALEKLTGIKGIR